MASSTTTQIARPARGIPHEALVAAGVAATLAAALAWLGPPGSDFAAHLYQSDLFEDHGFGIWNNFWYAGRYSFVTYSLLYYPLAALLGIKLLAVASIATAALAFGVVASREWGPASAGRTAPSRSCGQASCFPARSRSRSAWRWHCSRSGPSRQAVGALRAADGARADGEPRRLRPARVILAGIGLSRAPRRSELVLPLTTLGLATAVELVLLRLFPAGGRFPFSLPEFAAACVFCGLGIVLTWRVAAAGVLRWMYVVYLVACTAAYLVPSSLGENIARLRYAAIPIAILTLSLRRWRPLPVALFALTLAVAWNLTPLAGSFVKTSADPAANAAYWAPAVGFLREHLSPSYRVEAVDTVGHWPAAYLPAAGIPIARGWFRQDDFPRNDLLYAKLDRTRYVAWLRSLGVRYVVLPDAPLDYSAKEEAALITGGTSSLIPVFRSSHTTIYAVPSPRPIVTGPGRADVLAVRSAPDHGLGRAPRPLPHRDELVAVLDDGRRLPLARRRRDGAPDDQTGRHRPARPVGQRAGCSRGSGRGLGAPVRSLSVLLRAGLRPGREREAPERAVAEHVDGGVVDEQRHADRDEHRDDRRPLAASDAEPGKTSERQEAEERRVPRRRGSGPRDPEAPVEVVEQRAGAATDRVGDVTRAAEQRVDADDREPDREHSRDAEREPSRRQPHPRQAGKQDGEGSRDDEEPSPVRAGAAPTDENEEQEPDRHCARHACCRRGGE